MIAIGIESIYFQYFVVNIFSRMIIIEKTTKKDSNRFGIFLYVLI